MSTKTSQNQNAERDSQQPPAHGMEQMQEMMAGCCCGQMMKKMMGMCSPQEETDAAAVDESQGE